MVDERRTTLPARAFQLFGLAPAAAAALALIALSPAQAAAQTAPDTGFNAERMRIALDNNGIIDVEWAAVPEHLSLDLGLWLNYEHNAIQLYSLADGHRYGALLKHRLDGALMGSVGLFGFAEVGLEVPVVLWQGRDSDIPGATAQSLPSLASTKFGDIRISPKIQLLWAKNGFVDVAIIPAFTLPTAGSSDYAGEKGATFSPEFAVSKNLENGFRVGTNIGVLLRRQEDFLNQTVGNELEARLAVGYRFQEANAGSLPLELDLGLSGATSLPHPFDQSNQKELEIRGEATYRINELVQVFGGPGFGIGHGNSTPQWRAFAGARFFFGEKTPTQPPAAIPPQAPPPSGVVVIENPPPAPVQQIVVAGPRARLNNGRIEISEAVEFETGRDVITASSFGLLDNVAEVMKAHPEMQFRVEGHTDSDGAPDANLELSKRRAKAVVRYLIGRGTLPEQLTFEGYGETRPVADNKTKEGRAANRRVEFHVVGPQDAAGGAGK